MPAFLLGAGTLIGSGAFAVGHFAMPAASQADHAANPTPAADPAPLPALNPAEPFTLRSLDIHPDRLFAEYFDGAFSLPTDSLDSELGHGGNDFRYRLDMFVKTYGVDDNFSVRVMDDRTGQTLEVLTLRDLKDQYERTGRINWQDVDFPHRRDATSALRAKWEALGVPRESITIRWGRANQTLEAREREDAYIEYEIQLARQLGLSLLATEIGTVETFNQDRLVSSAGARSRYQMMPDILQMYDLGRYMIPTAGGRAVSVQEQEHPLLAMEPSFTLLRAYANAVGHELPGISAYHTGPGNLFRMYQAYVRARAADLSTDRHVTDAYMWGVTDGFETVRAQTSFGPESRIYVLKAYGALRAMEDREIDPARTVRAERVQLRSGATITLETLLTALAPHGDRVRWPADAARASLYERFRALNAHMDLPASPDGNVPADGNLLLASMADGRALRFFLPEGASEVIRRVGHDVIDPSKTFRYDRNTFVVEPGERLRADREYEALVRDISRFGFSLANKSRLDRLTTEMQTLARQRPTRYRRMQAHIIAVHHELWSTSSFRDLAGTVDTFLSFLPQRRAQQPVAAQPPVPTTPQADG
ncbi:MAG TPA: hypothetical protein VD962_10435 [Rubricoccaceae bacterium]|nr:hypothetical protein [Rubricoccaceae bacterium]